MLSTFSIVSPISLQVISCNGDVDNVDYLSKLGDNGETLRYGSGFPFDPLAYEAFESWLSEQLSLSIYKQISFGTGSLDDPIHFENEQTMKEQKLNIYIYYMSYPSEEKNSTHKNLYWTINEYLASDAYKKINWTIYIEYQP